MNKEVNFAVKLFIIYWLFTAVYAYLILPLINAVFKLEPGILLNYLFGIIVSTTSFYFAYNIYTKRTKFSGKTIKKGGLYAAIFIVVLSIFAFVFDSRVERFAFIIVEAGVLYFIYTLVNKSAHIK